MYLFNLRIFVCSNSYFKFFKSFIAPCNEVGELRLLIRRVSYFQFVILVYKYTPALAGDIMNEKLFLMHSVSLGIVH